MEIEITGEHDKKTARVYPFGKQRAGGYLEVVFTESCEFSVLPNITFLQAQKPLKMLEYIEAMTVAVRLALDFQAEYDKWLNG